MVKRAAALYKNLLVANQLAMEILASNMPPPAIAEPLVLLNKC
jgi:hypothetical protein